MFTVLAPLPSQPEVQALVAVSPDSVGQPQSGWSSGQRAASAGDALPARLAAQHLGSLAGMSRRVQEALMHSQRLLERQAAVVEQAVLARAFFVSGRLHERAARMDSTKVGEAASTHSENCGEIWERPTCVSLYVLLPAKLSACLC